VVEDLRGEKEALVGAFHIPAFLNSDNMDCRNPLYNLLDRTLFEGILVEQKTKVSNVISFLARKGGV
jgi:hypothetical protein